MRIGVLALQGAFIEHIHILRGLGVEAVEVRLPEHLDRLDGLIIPGGESTTIGKLAVQYGLLEPIRDMASAGKAIWGTCAGLILLARKLSGPRGKGADPPLLELMDITVARNAFGRQVDSFEVDLAIPALDAVSSPAEAGRPFHAVFIRAPRIEVVGPEIEVLARLDEGPVVAARQDHLLTTAFHPELTTDTRFHRYFLALAG
ncbi:MAG: pyridoxal 5'-phosphate synthase glutaminase subunit PdxT [Anaerolineae bacterium]|jgi:5'-phosphate synthase pdxT subunit|nr:pyridoxal 5'-phosphate synthase glutaminase subunit PdxT [Anaerolineae bacterium]MDH7473267.1 pyridoxal 5'-phosphate synthase glutaminase subunit PdxT [Anaerolineae bacterium]